MKASHNLARVSVSFDENHLLPNGGLAVAGVLAQKLGVAELVDAHVTLSGHGAGNSGSKALTVVGAALAGGDCIDDTDVLRAGAAPALFDGVRAPSTVGTWLRLFMWAAVRQLDRVTRELLRRAWAAGLGPDLDADLTIDIDSNRRRDLRAGQAGRREVLLQGGARLPPVAGVAGRHRRAVAHAPAWRQRRVRPGRGVVRGRDHRPCPPGRRPWRVDVARGLRVLRRRGGVCVPPRRGGVLDHRPQERRHPQGHAAIPDDAWTPIPYWIHGGADVAETRYTAFAGTRHEVTCRLLVRRVRPTPGSQLAMDVVFDYHAILTDRDGDLLEVEADHRRHAVVEHVVDDLKHHAGLAHLPSGRFAANTAWLTLVGIAYNLARWTARAAGLGHVTTKTLRLTIIATPARLVHRSRRRWLRMPTHWPWAQHIRDALAVFARIPAPG